MCIMYSTIKNFYKKINIINMVFSNNIVVKFFVFIFSKFFYSVVFYFIISCIIHYFLMKIFLHKILYKQECMSLVDSATVILSVYTINPMLYKAEEQIKPSDTIVSTNNTKKKSILKVHNNKTKKHVNNHKAMLDMNEDISISSVIQQKNDDTLNSTDVMYTSNVKNRDEYCNDNIQIQAPSCIIHRMYPEYPSRAKTLGIEGDVSVMYDINNSGKVKNIRILSAHPVGVFEKNVRAAMRLWTYKVNMSKKDLIVTFKFCFNITEILDCSIIK